MRLLNKSANQTTDLQNILTYVSKSFTNANEECKLDIYDGDSQLNPLWAFSYSRNTLQPAKVSSRNLQQEMTRELHAHLSNLILAEMLYMEAVQIKPQQSMPST